MANSDSEQNALYQLEQAAQVVMSPPGKVSSEQRRSAENLFLELRRAKSPFGICRKVFETSTNELVIFQAASAVKESTLREWTLLEPQDIQSVLQFLLCYVTNNPNLSGNVCSEILQAITMIVKRGILDKKAGETEALYSSIGQLIASPDIRLQALACQMLLSLCTEFCTTWRSSFLGLTWDFHIRAKRVFESSDLRRVLELSLRVLHGLASSGRALAREEVVLCNRLLCVAETVLNWNFGSRLLPKRLTFSIEFQPTAAFRPPKNWSDIILDHGVVVFFFQLHEKVRWNSELCHHSLQCLIQLSSVSGPVFEDEAQRDSFLSFFVQHLLDLFQDGPTSQEMLNTCILLNKLISYNPLTCLMRIPEPTLGNFIQFLTRLSLQLCAQAVQEMMGGGEENKLEESLRRVLDSWTVLLRAEARMLRNGFFADATKEIFSAFFQAVLCPPTGTRQPIPVDSSAAIDEFEEDDRVNYSEILCDVGIIGRHILPETIPLFSRVLEEKLADFNGMLLKGVEGDAAGQELASWQEDMHWILLMIGYLLAGEELDNTGFLHQETMHFLESRQGTSSLEDTRVFLFSCLATPGSIAITDAVDPIMRIVGTVLLWGNVEYQLLCEQRLSLLSPQLARTTLWVLRRLVSAYSVRDDTDSPLQIFNYVALKAMATETDLSAALVDFLIRKAFSVLNLWQGELEVAKDAVALLGSMAEYRTEEMCKSSNLLEDVGKLKLERLNTGIRRALLRALVLIGASTANSAVQEHMYLVILEPLAQRFHSLCGSGTGAETESSLLDVLDCFLGIAEASQIHSAQFLFKYLEPVLRACVPLLEPYTERAPVVEAVLMLFRAVTKHMAVYLESNEESGLLYSSLLGLLRTYTKHQVGRFHRIKDIEEEHANDLVLIMEILTNILSKDVLILAATQEESAGPSACAIALEGLDVVMPLMSEELLQFPSLCAKYYQLLLFVAEMFPENVCQLSEDMIRKLLFSIQLALSSRFGNEVNKSGLELTNVLATFVSQQTEEVLPGAQFIRANLSVFLQPVFESCLSTSCEVDVFSDASLTLYALICCDQAAYRKLVEELLGSHAEEAVRAKLREAFEQLLPSTEVARPLRTDKRAFRDRLETMMDKVQGLLCLSH